MPLCALVMAAFAPTVAADAWRRQFGAFADGSPVEAAEWSNRRGLTVRIIASGAAIQSLTMPDRDGTSADIVLGDAVAADHLVNPQNIGVSVGRFANRIAIGTVSLNGGNSTLEKNNGPNHLHGGRHGLGKVDQSTRRPPARRRGQCCPM
jgi:aldose 1-epimerase